MPRLFLILALALSWGSGLQAERSSVVVELFTSQGCSSCPPADKLMHALAERDDVIALALHVDYWDYIGWKDEFADPRNAERQRAYARTGHRHSVYTPEFIVNGETDIVGAQPMALMEAIAAHRDAPEQVELSVQRTGDRLSIAARNLSGKPGPFEVHLLRYQKLRPARITRGENAGRDFKYAQVTQDWRVISTWDGRAPFALEVDTPGAMPAVVLVQEPDGGKILAAAEIP